GVPSAPTVLASDVAVVAGLSEDWFPLLLKPTYGDNSQGLRLIRRRDDLWDVHWPEQLVVAQRYLPNDGFDLKFYVCGDRVFATRKPSPFNGDRSAVAQPVKPEAALVALALGGGRGWGGRGPPRPRRGSRCHPATPSAGAAPPPVRRASGRSRAGRSGAAWRFQGLRPWRTARSPPAARRRWNGRGRVGPRRPMPPTRPDWRAPPPLRAGNRRRFPPTRSARAAPPWCCPR